MMVFKPNLSHHHFSYESRQWQNRIFILLLIFLTSIDCILLDLSINNVLNTPLPWLISNQVLQHQIYQPLDFQLLYVLYKVFHHLKLFHYRFWWYFQEAKGNYMLLLIFLYVIIRNRIHGCHNRQQWCSTH